MNHATEALLYVLAFLIVALASACGFASSLCCTIRAAKEKDSKETWLAGLYLGVGIFCMLVAIFVIISKVVTCDIMPGIYEICDKLGKLSY